MYLRRIMLQILMTTFTTFYACMSSVVIDRFSPLTNFFRRVEYRGFVLPQQLKW